MSQTGKFAANSTTQHKKEKKKTLSRVGKLPIVLPKDVEVSIEQDAVRVKGAGGVLQVALHPLIQVQNADGVLRLTPRSLPLDPMANAMLGTMRQLISNMVEGVSKGFEKKLTLVGVGYKAQASGSELTLNVGHSHPVVFSMPAGIKVQTPAPTEIVIQGADRQRVGQIAAQVRAARPPEPYKGKGVRYANERIVLKVTKKK